MKARTSNKALRVGADDAHHVAATHTITDRADAARANRLTLRQEVEDRSAIGDDHGVRQLLQRGAHLDLALGVEIVHRDHLAPLVAPLMADAALAIVEIR